DHRLLDVGVGDAHGTIVEERAVSAARTIQLAVHRRGDRAERELVAGHERDRHAEMRNAVRKIRRAVDRVDHPDRIARPLGTAFLAEKRVLGETRLQARNDHALDLAVGLGDVVLLTLELDLDRLRKIFARQLARLARDGDECLLSGDELFVADYHFVQYRFASDLRQSWPMRAWVSG